MFGIIQGLRKKIDSLDPNKNQALLNLFIELTSLSEGVCIPMLGSFP